MTWYLFWSGPAPLIISAVAGFVLLVCRARETHLRHAMLLQASRPKLGRSIQIGPRWPGMLFYRCIMVPARHDPRRRDPYREALVYGGPGYAVQAGSVLTYTEPEWSKKCTCEHVTRPYGYLRFNDKDCPYHKALDSYV